MKTPHDIASALETERYSQASYIRIIANLEAKLKRQELAVADTKAQINGFQLLQKPS